jgi:eukaryotic-like serine/threonine-protein kinase
MTGRGSLVGKYQLLDMIGAGGLAEVFRARSMDGRPPGLVAVKRLRDKWQARKDIVDMFATEADLGLSLIHPSIVRTHEIGFDAEGRLFIVMEYVAGRSIADLLHKLGDQQVVAFEVSLHIICQVLSGLHHAHELLSVAGRKLQLIHRDISPDNVLISFGGEVKLSDFGVAHMEGIEGAQGKSQAFGKIPYMAPELILQQDIDRRIDIYAAGILLYELLTGAHPFVLGPKDSNEEISARVVKGKYAKARKLVPAIPPTLEAVIDMAMATSRDERFSSASSMFAALQPFYRSKATWAPIVGGMMRQLFPQDYQSYLAAAR